MVNSRSIDESRGWLLPVHTFIHTHIHVHHSNQGKERKDARTDLDVLPVLLEQRGEEVGGQLDVERDLLLGHLHVPDRHRHAHHLVGGCGLALIGQMHGHFVTQTQAHIYRTFFIWNLMVALTVSIFSISLSPAAMVVGNLPACYFRCDI